MPGQSGSRLLAVRPECADARERKIADRLERNGVALPNFLHRDQRHFGEDLSVLKFGVRRYGERTQTAH